MKKSKAYLHVGDNPQFDQHTPTPQYDLTHLAMVGPDGLPVFLIPSAMPDQKLNTRRKEERAFIVRAVNCHEKLLAALKRCYDALGDYGESNEACGNAMEQADQAIANAEGIIRRNIVRAVNNYDLAIKYLEIEHRKEKSQSFHPDDCDLCEFISEAKRPETDAEKANAAYSVRAVNCHAELLACLKSAWAQTPQQETRFREAIANAEGL